jgi:hypothetical protein
MKVENKIFIKSFLLSGLVYTTFMAGFDYYDKQNFSLVKFIFHFLFFGLFIGLMTRYSHLKLLKKQRNENESRPCDTSL